MGIEADTNAATFLTPTTSIELHEMPKRELADRILDEILTLRRPRSLVVELDDEDSRKKRQNRSAWRNRSACRAATVDCGVSELARQLDAATREALVERIRFYRELGLTELYRRPVEESAEPAVEAASRGRRC